jgi:hypothetical protein
MCVKKNPCGHYCPCAHPTTNHMSCLEPDCVSDKEGGAVTAEDYCNVCWSEELGAAPCVKLTCGHIFHYQCIKKRLEKKWSTPAISFAFTLCPLCNKRIENESFNSEMNTFQRWEDDMKVRWTLLLFMHFPLCHLFSLSSFASCSGFFLFFFSFFYSFLFFSSSSLTTFFILSEKGTSSTNRRRS